MYHIPRSVRVAFPLLLLGAIPATAQDLVPIPASEVQYRREIFKDGRVSAFLLELPPQHATLMHRHDRDILSIFVNGGRTIGTFEGRAPVTDTFPVGDARFRGAGFTHATHNIGTDVFRSVILEFAEPQGPVQQARHSGWQYCNPGSSSACVTEKYLLCTGKICVEDVTMAPGAVRGNRAYATDQLLVAISDYTLVQEAEDQAAQIRTGRTGDVERIPAGPAHQWRNATSELARMILITFR